MSVPVVGNDTEARGFDSLALAVCLVVAFGLRLAVIVNQPDQLTQDRDVYLATAKGLVEGRGYSIPNSSVATAFRPPVYPMCLAVGLFLLSPPLAVAAVNLLSGLLTVWLTARLGASLQLGRSRFIAAFLVAVDPLLLRYSAQPMTESLCTLLAVFWLWSMIAASALPVPRSRLRGLTIGVAFGLLVLSRPTFWPMAGLCGLGWLIHLRRTSPASAEATRVSDVRTAVYSTLGAVVIVTPWLVRNWLVFSVPILTTTHGGYTLLLGNNPVFYDVVRQPWGTVWSNESQQVWETEMKSKMERELAAHATDVEVDAWQSRQARSFISAQPAHFFEAALHRVRSLWNTIPQGEQSGPVSHVVIAVIGWFTTVVLAMGLLSVCLLLRRGEFARWEPLYALIITVQLVHLFYWTNTRMRAPLVPAIALFAAALVAMCRDTSERPCD